MHTYRVVDLRSDTISPHECTASGPTPEKAASDTLNVELVRSGVPANLAARVYWKDHKEQVNMVRLYSRVTAGPNRVAMRSKGAKDGPAISR